MTSKPDFKVTVLLLVFMQLTRDLFAIAKFLLTLEWLMFLSKPAHTQKDGQTIIQQDKYITVVRTISQKILTCSCNGFSQFLSVYDFFLSML